MIVANEKRKKNVAEYILYMWQIEDIVRALDLDASVIETYVRKNYCRSEEETKEIVRWFLDIANEMRAKELHVKGHIDRIHALLQQLNDAHRQLLKMPSQSLYQTVYYQTLPTIIQLRSKSGEETKDEIETCFIGIYGYLSLRLQGKEISDETTQAVKQVSTYLAMLADRFREYEEGRLDLSVGED